MRLTRRRFIANSVLTTAGLYAGITNANENLSITSNKNDPPADDMSFKLSVFSKTLHWMDYQSMASAMADLGFDGIDLTVRPEGHVLPELVTEDLPKAYEIITKSGLRVYSIVTAISDADDPLTEKILKTARGLGIRLYRLGWFHYDDKLPIEENLKNISGKMKKLEVLNKKYGMIGLNQNHSGQYFSAPIWDLAQTLKSCDPAGIGSQYDIYHATVEGMNSWIYGFQMIQPYIKMINVKDFQWTKKDGVWKTETVPMGEGAVNWKSYLELLKSSGMRVPISIHYEYPLGGAESGAKTITIPKEQIFAAMKKDLLFTKRILKESGLVS